MDLSYALGVTIFGGLTPLAVTSLIHAMGGKLIVGLYLSCAAVVSAFLLLFYRPVSDKRTLSAAV